MHYLRAFFSALLTTACSLVVVLGLAALLAGLALYHLRPSSTDWQTQLQIPLPAALAQVLDHQARAYLPSDWHLRSGGAPSTAISAQAKQANGPQQPQGKAALPATTAAAHPAVPNTVPSNGRASLIVPIGIAAAVDWITSPTVARLLGGTQWNTRYGPMAFEWDADSQTQTLVCQACSATLPALGSNPISLPELRIALQREGPHLQGQAQAGALQARWTALLQRQQLDIDLQFDEQPIRSVFAAFAAQIPEVEKAQIDGTLALQVQLSLPSWQLEMAPQISDFRVQGLGTETLPTAPNHCPRRNDLPVDVNGFLARAVIATEDQRFYQHPGYDLAAWQDSLQHNQTRNSSSNPSDPQGKPVQPLRGGSTLTQQLAKFVYTDGDRTALRKLRELLYTVELEQTLGKEGILRQYLERVYWGEGTCGAQDAAEHYFGQSPDSLNPAQAAWLAAMLHRPDYHAQRWTNTGRIDVRRTQWVLDQMRMLPPLRMNQRERQRWQRFVTENDWRRSR
ncbi:glycosyl transferase [Lampropedia aestuarii]|uniref:Glycosyl transferase n=1 Tax=Lampropedia aestuarii TaxID=2562762 RepID=A0A4S5BI14_9BURK|nr:biosynthetic peptidoglycan transglycosylase [Lampropedia aestuarii]THJ31749.1 glycosyl transferase [Lampropedia aestuarii]